MAWEATTAYAESFRFYQDVSAAILTHRSPGGTPEEPSHDVKARRVDITKGPLRRFVAALIIEPTDVTFHVWANGSDARIASAGDILEVEEVEYVVRHAMPGRWGSQQYLVTHEHP